MTDNPYYVDPETGKITRGALEPWNRRMGPYETLEAAQHALETVRRRNEAWDEQDKDWREGDDLWGDEAP